MKKKWIAIFLVLAFFAMIALNYLVLQPTIGRAAYNAYLQDENISKDEIIKIAQYPPNMIEKFPCYKVEYKNDNYGYGYSYDYKNNILFVYLFNEKNDYINEKVASGELIAKHCPRLMSDGYGLKKYSELDYLKDIFKKIK